MKGQPILQILKYDKKEVVISFYPEAVAYITRLGIASAKQFRDFVDKWVKYGLGAQLDVLLFQRRLREQNAQLAKMHKQEEEKEDDYF